MNPPESEKDPVKLTELEPRWIQMGKDFGFHCLIGISFLCPCCRKQRLAVMFKEHIDPENNAWRIPWQWPEGKTWARQGNSFETLSLSPSIDASASGHWHGFITNGELS